MNGDLFDVGITARQSILLEPGLEINFRAALKGISPDDQLALIWDPGTSLRESGDGPGLIEVVLGDGTAQLIVVQENTACQQDLLDTEPRLYTVVISQDLNISFLIDNEMLCTVRIHGLQEDIGLISFTGLGWVDDVLVTR